MKRLRLSLSGLLLTLALLAVPAAASADVNNFTVTSFKSDQTLSRNDPQGELRIVEEIKVDFTDNNHGILRAIPESYKSHSLQVTINSVSSASGAPARYKAIHSEEGNLVIKIGDPNRTVTGAQQYTIDYTVRNVITFYEDHDELYWDVNGDQWGQPFKNVSVTLRLPDGVSRVREPVCYTGSYGENQSNCAIESTDPLVVRSAGPLTPHQTLTYVMGFQKGYFRPSTTRENVGEYAKGLTGFFIPVILLGGAGFAFWRSRGRDPKGRGTIIPQYDAPDQMTPLQASTILDFQASNKALTATIVSLAVRGYLKIVESKQDLKFRKDRLSYSLQLVNADISRLDASETKLVKALFKDLKPGETVDINAKKNKLYETSSSIRASVKKQLTQNGYFRDNSLKSLSKSRLVTLGWLVLLFILIDFLVFEGAAVFGSIAGLLIFIVFALFINARTQKGVEAKEHLLGLKLYLDVAEKDRLQKLQAPDAAYAENAHEPVRTVELFEKLLPYAIVLGVERQWAEQFKDLYVSPPDWYAGNWTTFNAVYLTSTLNSGVGAAVDTAFTAPSSSSGSGFGGGGFSGGGGGGGGGGGW